MSEPDEVPPPRGRDPDPLGQPAARTSPASRSRRSAPRTGEPAGPDDLTPIFPMGLIAQEVLVRAGDPDPRRRCARPTSCGGRRRCTARAGSSRRSARRRASSTSTRASPPPARTSRTPPCRRPTRTRRPASKKLATETGAGQWGSSLAFACSLFGLECEVFMVGSSYDQKPYRRSMMETWGASVHRSPSRPHRRPAARRPSTRPARSGIAISEAVEVAAGDPTCNYALGSVLNHVLLHQTVIGQEAIAQLELAGAGMPDVIVGCVGGGSNFGGLVFPFLRAGADVRIVAAEPAACPTLTRGVYSYDYGDTVGMTPLMPMYTLGHGFVPPPVHAGGLRYHGDAPMVCALVQAGRVEARAYRQNETFEAAVTLRPLRGDHPRARAGARDPRGDRGGVRRRGEDDPVRPLRPRALRPRRLRRLPGGPPRGPGVLRVGSRGGARAAARAPAIARCSASG